KPLDILIDMNSDLTINTWNESKIKIETSLQYQGDNELSDAEWLEKLGISMRMFGSTVRVKSKTNKAFTYIANGGERKVYTAPVYSGDGRSLTWEKGYRPVTLYVPAESILEIEAEQGFLTIKSNIKRLSVTNNNCQVDVANVDRLQLRGKQGSFTGGIIGDGDIQILHGRLTLNELNEGNLTSSYSTIEIESIGNLKLSSSNDEIDIDNAVTLYGIKNFGNLRINQLTGKLDLQGINSDIKVRHINPSAQLIKLVNRNADLRLSANDLSNFSVDVKGSYNKIYSSFAEKTTVDTLPAKEADSLKTLMAAVPSGGIITAASGTSLSTYSANSNTVITVTGYGLGGNKQSPNLKYSARIGTGNQFKYQIICTTCIIDFK
ncbi:MAG: hypothetical protein J7502_17120, partial [Flavisolibacter sp.]|nr:hypothetical protein [Flavisolibacter sp.]